MDTSVWNFLFADDAPDKKIATETFFQEVESGKYEIFISEAVRAEINDAPRDKWEKLDALINKYKPVELEFDDEVKRLADLYVENEVLAEKNYLDLLHLAYATVSALNVLVSWNLKHLVKMKTITLSNNINRANGYHEIMIFTPEAVIGYGN